MKSSRIVYYSETNTNSHVGNPLILFTLSNYGATFPKLDGSGCNEMEITLHSLPDKKMQIDCSWCMEKGYFLASKQATGTVGRKLLVQKLYFLYLTSLCLN